MHVRSFNIPCSGYSLAADWYEGNTTKKILFYIHGYSTTKKRQAKLITEIIKRKGYSAISFDLSGHGDSPFELSDTRPAQHFLEIIYVFDWLRTKYPSSEIYVFGSSYGGFLATQLTKYRRFDKLILKVPAIYRPEAFYDLWAIRENDPEGYTSRQAIYRKDAGAIAKHPLLARASQFKGKTFVIVHENDELVPRQTTDAFINTFRADSYLAPRFSHSITQYEEMNEKEKKDFDIYCDKIAGWLDES